jgi:hypothetical protein
MARTGTEVAREVMGGSVSELNFPAQFVRGAGDATQQQEGQSLHHVIVAAHPQWARYD